MLLLFIPFVSAVPSIFTTQYKPSYCHETGPICLILMQYAFLN